LDLAELALRFVLSLPSITSILVGVERLDQLLPNVAIVRRGPLPAPLLEEARALLPDLPVAVTTPAEWERVVPPV
jgi:aryl-alcohol dehydrogenase-like predicted oxidoreductase